MTYVNSFGYFQLCFIIFNEVIQMFLAGGGLEEVIDSIEPTLTPVKQLVTTPVVEVVGKSGTTGFVFDWMWVLYFVIFLVAIFVIRYFWPKKPVV